MSNRTRIVLLILAAGVFAVTAHAAITQSRVVLTAQEARNIAADLRDAHSRAKAFIAYNSSQAIDWANLSNGANGIDANGNVEGEDYSKAEVANAIGSIQEFVDLMDNAAVSQGNHLGNLHKLASPQ